MANGSVVTKEKKINYEKNLREEFGWEDPAIAAIKNAAGILKGKIKDPVKWQRSIRKEWDTRMKKLEKLHKETKQRTKRGK